MRLFRFPYTIPGQLLIALLGGIMIIGNTGCTSLQISGLGGGAGGGGSTITGFLINTDKSSDVLAALRIPGGNELFVYGTFRPDGNIGDVQGAVFRDTSGREASATFVKFGDAYLLDKAKGFDGSTVTCTYDEVTTARLKGKVVIFLAGATGADQNQTVNFDVDLQQAAADLAAQIQQLTGLVISNRPPPQNPGGKEILADLLPSVGGKDEARSQFILALFAPFYQYAVAGIGYVMIQLMGSIMQAMFAVVAVALRAVIVAAFTPFLLLGDLMRGAATQTVNAISILVQLGNAGVSIPPRPRL